MKQNVKVMQEFNIISTETGREGIEKIVSEINQPFITQGIDKIKAIHLVQPKTALPSFLDETAKNAIEYTIDSYLNEFPRYEVHFPFGRPLVKARVIPRFSYRIEMSDATLTISLTTMASVQYSSFEILHKIPLTADTVSSVSMFKGKFVALLDSNAGKSRILATDNCLELQTQKSDDNSMADDVFYIASHEAVHLVTMPWILKHAADAYNLEIKELAGIPGLNEAIETAGYSLGLAYFSLYRQQAGITRNFSPRLKESVPGVLRAVSLFEKAGDIKHLHSLLEQEICSLLKP